MRGQVDVGPNLDTKLEDPLGVVYSILFTYACDEEKPSARTA